MEKIKTFRGSDITEQVNDFIEKYVDTLVYIKYKPLVANFSTAVVETALLVYIPKEKSNEQTRFKRPSFVCTVSIPDVKTCYRGSSIMG